MPFNLFDDSEEGFDDGRGCWEPRGFYFFRRLFRISLGAFLIVLFVIGFSCRLWPHVAPGFYVALWIALGITLAVAIVSGIGIFLTAPTDKKRRRRNTHSGEDRHDETQTGL